MAQQFNVMQSLFGFAPEDIQRQIQQEQEKRALDIASGVTGGLGPAVFQAARAQERARGTPLFEMQQDPRMIKARAMSNARQAAASAFQSGGMAGYMNEYANQLEAAGLTAEAAQARAAAAEEQRKAAESEATIGLRGAQAVQAMAAAGRERTPAALEQADRTRLAQLIEEFGQVEGARKFREERDEAARKTAAAGAQQTPTEKAVLPGKAKILGDVETAAMNAGKTLETATALDRVLTTAFTGFGADAKLRIGQVANALGVTVTGTSETEQLKQLLAQLAQGQARTLPGALSEKELAFLREAIGTPGFTVTTLRNVVNRLRTDALASKYENDDAQAFVSQGGDLNKYDFAKSKSNAIDRAKKEISDRETKLKRIEELRAKQRGL